MSERSRPPEAQLMRMGRGLRRALHSYSHDQPTELVRRQGYERLQARLQRDRNKRGRGMYVLGATAAVALLVGGGYLVSPDPALTFVSAGVTEPSSGYIRVGAQEPPVRIAFSDGSRLVVQPESQARIAHLTADGARVALEGGSLHLKVNPRPNASWSVEAGPYRIHVTGTEFDVNWRAPKDVLEVIMRKGSVRVVGPMTTQGIRVAAGERLVANLSSSELRLGAAEPIVVADAEVTEPLEATGAKPSGSPEPKPTQVKPKAKRADKPKPKRADKPKLKRADKPTQTEQEPPKAADDALAPPTHREPSSLGSSPRSGETWSDLMKESDYPRIVADAQRRGLDEILSSATLSELVILADAARYSGQPRVATRALVAERKRFAGSNQSRAAAFMLGRIAEDHLGDAKTALRWYTTYLQESPSGAFASEALGRKMSLVRSTRGRAAANSLAEFYLQRYPKGPYAMAAKKILLQ